MSWQLRSLPASASLQPCSSLCATRHCDAATASSFWPATCSRVQPLMSGGLLDVASVESTLLGMAATFAVMMAVVVALERVFFALIARRTRRVESRYAPLIGRALAGEAAALQTLRDSPSRHRLDVARLLIEPLIDDRD